MLLGNLSARCSSLWTHCTPADRIPEAARAAGRASSRTLHRRRPSAPLPLEILEGKMAKKLSTEEILKAARAQSAKAASPSEPPAEAAAAQQPGPAAAEAAPAPPADPKPAAAPKSTKDILAAARAQSTGGAAAASAPKPAAPAAPAGGAPKSTKDILAAARAQTAGGATPAAAGAPKSTKDILAAARAQTQGGAAPTAAEKPVAAKAAAVKAAPAAAKPTGNRPSVQEMLKAAREGRPMDAQRQPRRRDGDSGDRQAGCGSPGNSAKTGAGRQEARICRRGTSGIFGDDVGRNDCLLGHFLRNSLPSRVDFVHSGFRFGRALYRPLHDAQRPSRTAEQIQSWACVGLSAGGRFHEMDRSIRRVGGPQRIQRQRRHLRASDRLHTSGLHSQLARGRRKFKCPCHGSGYYITGVNFEGPAPRPLERMAIRVAEDGALEVDKSRKFQEEMGQWNDPASFVPVA